MRSEQPAITALPAKQRPLTTAMRGTTGQRRPQLRRRAPRARGHRGVVGVAGPPAAALGEEHGRQPHPFDELEQPVLLPVPEDALGAGEHGVVVGQHRGGGAVRTEEVAVDPRDAGDQTVGGGCGRSDRRRRAAGVAQPSRNARTRRTSPGRRVGDVLARGAPVRGVPAADGVGRAASRSAPAGAASHRDREPSGHELNLATPAGPGGRRWGNLRSASQGGPARIASPGRPLGAIPIRRHPRQAAEVRDGPDGVDHHDGPHRAAPAERILPSPDSWVCSRWRSLDHRPPATCSVDGAVTAVMTALALAALVGLVGMVLTIVRLAQRKPAWPFAVGTLGCCVVVPLRRAMAYTVAVGG